MTVRKRPERPDKIDVDALIAKGAMVKADFIEDKKMWAFMTLRIGMDMLKDVDYSVSERVGISRTGWILEAIHEKLKREKMDNK